MHVRRGSEDTMPKMRAIQVSRPKGPLELVERNIPEPAAGTVRIKVEACGVCHSDVVTVEGLLPGIEYPRVPGHEVLGTIDAVGAGVTGFTQGQRVGVGWNGGYDGRCDACRRGDFPGCRLGLVTGISSDGGYAEYMIARVEAVARVPAGMSGPDPAPLMCAGVTTFNALRNSGARGGDVVAVIGIGGLGHLAVQFAAKMGFFTVAIARGKDKEPLAKELGASAYIDNKEKDVAAELAKLGGARVVLATATNAEVMSASLGGIASGGTLMVLGVPAEPIPVPAFQLISPPRSIRGWYSGVAIDSEDTLAFADRAEVRSMNELFPMERVAEAYARMTSGKVRYRAVLTMT
jgi:D-arabinose 1-dehydrogenase-like Zn-dependent alcohol dehydrogenase